MEKKIAEMLLKLGAVTLSPKKPFTWASGLRSPIYCDNRTIISHVKGRKQVVAAFLERINERNMHPQIIAGTATAGIPHAAWLADALDLPMIYVRSSEKKHGRKNKIEGCSPENKKVLLIEDLISTGGSSISAAQAIQECGGQVLHVASIFSYGLRIAEERFQNAKIPYSSLCSLATLLCVAKKTSRINDEEWSLLEHWAVDPEAWSDRH
ncbi:MAG: orotate phosphoribosyltransferase [Acidobacteria bacterium]|nr:MAG: orotate phosphoribosyltransferase [Acidobacteriota bacterium]